MRAFKLLAATLAAFLLATPANPATLWSIYWASDWSPCGDGVLMFNAQSGYVHGTERVSIKPRPDQYPYPFDSGQNITVIGCHITHYVTDQSGATGLLIGSGHGGDGADVFCSTGGQGSTHATIMFPPGVGLPQGPVGDPNVSHFDVYGTCSSGQQRAVVNIFYTSP